jgi:hypothetical protein
MQVTVYKEKDIPGNFAKVLFRTARVHFSVPFWGEA